MGPVSENRIFCKPHLIAPSQRSVTTTTGGELVPVEAEVDNKQRGEGKRNDADG